MTERDKDQLDIWARQGLLSGNRVPILWNGDKSVLFMLHKVRVMSVEGR
jgi:hypothetical protein